MGNILLNKLLFSLFDVLFHESIIRLVCIINR